MSPSERSFAGSMRSCERRFGLSPHAVGLFAQSETWRVTPCGLKGSSITKLGGESHDRRVNLHEVRRFGSAPSGPISIHPGALQESRIRHLTLAARLTPLDSSLGLAGLHRVMEGRSVYLLALTRLIPIGRKQCREQANLPFMPASQREIKNSKVPLWKRR
jgi:hypothetical protein